MSSAFEFRYRFAILGMIYCLAFWMTGYQSHGHYGFVWIQITDWLSRWDTLSTDANSIVLRSIVSVLAVSAAALRTWSAAHLRSAIVHANDVRTDSIVTSGPFAYLRSPLYLGVILITLAYAPMNNPLPALFMVIAITLFLTRLALREESELLRTHGEAYAAYKNSVPRFLPRLRPYRSTTSTRPAWPQAFLGELWFWGLATATIAYAFTFSIGLFSRILVIGFGAYLIMRAFLPSPDFSRPKN